MSHGTYLSLEEARKAGKLKEFAKEHPAKGDGTRFNKLLGAMASGKQPEERQTSGGETSED